MDIASRIQQLEEIVREAKSMPLSSSALLNREELLELLAAMRESLPEEIKQARWVVRDREELLAKARRDADGVIVRAQQEQARLVQLEAVAQAAQEEAERIVSEARDQARQVRMEADDYVDGKLAQFEITLQRVQEALGATQETMAESFERVQGALEKTGELVTRGREKLAGPLHPAQALSPEEPPEEEEALP